MSMSASRILPGGAAEPFLCLREYAPFRLSGACYQRRSGASREKRQTGARPIGKTWKGLYNLRQLRN